MAVLSKASIERRLAAGEIFHPATWCSGNLRPAAYDLRVADDYAISPEGTRYWDGNRDGLTRLTEPLRLQPGDVAFVSTIERLVMPRDLAGNIAVRFRLARQGLLVMGGSLVDPGYGLGGPAIGNKGRLHFQLANIGSTWFELRVGDKIAAIQFLELDDDMVLDGNEPEITSSAVAAELFNHSPENPLQDLSFFPDLRRFETEGRDRERRLQNAIDRHDARVREMEQSTNRLLVFGIFLIAATLLGVSVAALLSLASREPLDVESVGGAAVLLLGLVIVIAAVAVALSRFANGLLGLVRGPEPPPTEDQASESLNPKQQAPSEPG